MNPTETHYCGSKCGRETTWKVKRDGTQCCTECRTLFPCATPCDHLDCGERRAEMRVERRVKHVKHVEPVEPVKLKQVES